MSGKLIPMPSREPLVQRKQRQARRRIMDAADDLFLERGYDAVTVGDIAEHAEVGRTTFFRLFGDKQEVVFARQQELLDVIESATQHDAAAAGDLADAVEQLRPLVLDLCALAVSDPQGYTRHYQLIEQHSELLDRDAVKTQQIAKKLSELLVHRGFDEATAMLASQIAVACCQAAKLTDNDPRTLVERTEAAFGRVLTLGIDSLT